MSNAHDFFKKTAALFEGKVTDQEKSNEKMFKQQSGKGKEPKATEQEKGLAKLQVDKKPASNVKESGADFFRKYADIVAEGCCEAEEKEIKEDEPRFDQRKKAEKTTGKKDDQKPVKESAEDEDDDVKAADSVKGKDGKTQKEADKKLPPWLQKGLDKADKKAEEKGAKKLKKDKEALDEAQNRFNVRLNGKLIDTVHHNSKDPEVVKDGLVNHDGFDSNIKVTLANKDFGKKEVKEALDEDKAQKAQIAKLEKQLKTFPASSPTAKSIQKDIDRLKEKKEVKESKSPQALYDAYLKMVVESEVAEGDVGTPRPKNRTRPSVVDQHNMDAAQREMDRRESEGEDMTGAKIDSKTYEIIKPKKQVKENFASVSIKKSPVTETKKSSTTGSAKILRVIQWSDNKNVGIIEIDSSLSPTSKFGLSLESGKVGDIVKVGAIGKLDVIRRKFENISESANAAVTEAEVSAVNMPVGACQARIVQVMKDVAAKYSSEVMGVDSIPAGPDSTKFSATRSGMIEYVRGVDTGGGQYSIRRHYVDFLKIGGRLDYKLKEKIIEEVKSKIATALSQPWSWKFTTIKSNAGDSYEIYFSETSGSNWGGIGCYYRKIEADKVSESTQINEWVENKDFAALWTKYVPSQGNADSEMGEAIRALGRLEYDYYNNGYGNAREQEYSQDNFSDEDEEDEYGGYGSEEAIDIGFTPYYADLWEKLEKFVQSKTQDPSVVDAVTDLDTETWDRKMSPRFAKAVSILKNFFVSLEKNSGEESLDEAPMDPFFQEISDDDPETDYKDQVDDEEDEELTPAEMELRRREEMGLAEDEDEEDEICPSCDGSGMGGIGTDPEKSSCRTCGGSGSLTHKWGKAKHDDDYYADDPRDNSDYRHGLDETDMFEAAAKKTPDALMEKFLKS